MYTPTYMLPHEPQGVARVHVMSSGGPEPPGHPFPTRQARVATLDTTLGPPVFV